MRKKILVAEQSDTIRNIAESILHQNGFDVICATEGEKARTLIISEQPNLVIIGADIKDPEGKYLYESLGENEATKQIPLLLIEDPNGAQLPYPPEVVLSRPFEPGEFLDKVSTFIGTGDSQPAEKITESSPFGGGSVDDEFLDAALGIDEIEVEESEVMDKTWTSKQMQNVSSGERKDAFDIVQHANGDNSDSSDSGKVESLMIRDDDKAEEKDTNIAESSKIQLDNDQYGMTAKEEEPAEQESDPADKDHDYDWFLDEMKNDSSEDKKPEEDVAHDTNPNLNVTKTSDSLENVDSNHMKQTDKENGSGGVDQFISDFKKEMQDIASQDDSSAEGDIKTQFEAEIESISTEEIPESAPKKPIDEKSILNLDPDEIHRISSYVVELLAERLAKNIVEKIDREEIYKILQDELPNFLAEKK